MLWTQSRVLELYLTISCPIRVEVMLFNEKKLPFDFLNRSQ